MGFLQELRKSMALSTPCPFVLSFLMVFFILQTPTFAAPQSYIVYMGMPSYDASDYLYQDEKVTKSHFDLLATYLNRDEEIQKQMLYSYTRSINGFAAILNDSQAAAMERNPEVLAVFPNRERKLHTTHSWRFLGLENNGGSPSHGSLWDNAKFGEDVIIGNLDTGVWPESESFNDEGMGPIPSKWNGICQSEGKVRCNKKLIGARYFYKGFEAQNGRLSPDKVSARDTEGHGSHTLSTAGGSFVPGASVFGIGNGTAKGGSPKARVAAYKVCWPAVGGGGCYDADILAAFDAAITDGVDVISVSLGGPPFEFFQDGTSLGSFQAMKRGISVVISAGNEGPDPYSVKNVAPWLLTVGASTMDRDFTSFVTLGNKKRLKGQSLSDKSLPEGKFYPLINSADAALPNASSADSQFCKSRSLDPKKVAGKILICLRGDNSRVEKGHEAALAGAVGMILANDPLNGNGIVADPHVLPASHLTFTDGEVVYDYIKNTTNPTASISPVKTVLGTKPAPVMADFTSRGPNVLDEAILKPDITAPGVNVIAAYTKAAAPTSGDYDNRRVPFITMSGTSMACPHVSGIVGLLKSIHPDWSPAAIKSAIMTTAKSRANNRKAILDSNLVDANAFAYGSGHVHPNHAADPGLVYDLTVDDYLNYLCGRGYNQTTLRAFSKRKYECPKDFSMANFNYPSISVPQLNGPTTVTRTVKNVGDPGTYTVEVREPVAVSVDVEPNSLTFAKVGEEKTYKVTLKPTAKGQPKAYTFGHLTWSDGKHRVTSPLVVKHK